MIKITKTYTFKVDLPSYLKIIDMNIIPPISEIHCIVNADNTFSFSLVHHDVLCLKAAINYLLKDETSYITRNIYEEILNAINNVFAKTTPKHPETIKEYTHYRVYGGEIIRISPSGFGKDLKTDTDEIIDAPEGCKYFRKFEDAEKELLKQQSKRNRGGDKQCLKSNRKKK